MLQRSPDEDARPGFVRTIEHARRSPFLRILLIGFLVVLLQIPIAMIQELIWERQNTGQEAIAEVTGKWGLQQSLLGPRILVPFTDSVTRTSQDGKPFTVAVTAAMASAMPVASMARSSAEKRAVVPSAAPWARAMSLRTCTVASSPSTRSRTARLASRGTGSSPPSAPVSSSRFETS